MIQMFGEYVYRENNPILRKSNSEYLKRALEVEQTTRNGDVWLSNTYNTLGSYDLAKDILYIKIISLVEKKVLGVAVEYGVHTDKIICTDSWINVSHTGSFQEYHLHASNHFSVVYYISVPENSGDIIFRSAETQTDMFPLPATVSTLAGNKTFSISPEQGDILIFRSNVLHMVSLNKSKEPRVSMAMNFIVG